MIHGLSNEKETERALMGYAQAGGSTRFAFKAT